MIAELFQVSDLATTDLHLTLITATLLVPLHAVGAC